MAVSFAKLLEAYNIVDTRGAENVVYLCRQTGQTYWRSDFPDFGDLHDELPDDVEDETKYIQVPDKYELDLGKALVFDFVREVLPDDYGDVRDFMGRRGGYRKFRALVERRRVLQRWYDFERDAIHSPGAAGLVRGERDRADGMTWAHHAHQSRGAKPAPRR